MALTLLVISPHLDDAVLDERPDRREPRCGRRDGVRGSAERPGLLDGLDRACGFDTAEEALTTRRRRMPRRSGSRGDAAPSRLRRRAVRRAPDASGSARRAARPDRGAVPGGGRLPRRDRQRGPPAGRGRGPAGDAPVHRYAELPYAAGLRLEPPPGWRRMDLGDHRAARRAAGCYRSQLDLAGVSQLHEEAVWRT